MSRQVRDEHKAQYLRAVFDAIPHPTFIVDDDVQILDFNTAAEQFLGTEPASTLHRRGGEAFHCIHAQSDGCGKAESCKDCIIRNSVNKAMTGTATCRELHKARLRSGRGTVSIDLLVTASLLPYTDTPQALLVLEDMTSIIKAHRSEPNPRRSQSRFNRVG